VEVGDDVSGFVPHEPGPAALGDLLDLRIAAAPADVARADVDDGGRGRLEEGHGDLLVLAEIAALGDGARLGVAPQEAALRQGPRRVEAQDQDEDDGEKGAREDPTEGGLAALVASRTHAAAGRAGAVWKAGAAWILLRASALPRAHTP